MWVDLTAGGKFDRSDEQRLPNGASDSYSILRREKERHQKTSVKCFIRRTYEYPLDPPNGLNGGSGPCFCRSVP